MPGFDGSGPWGNGPMSGGGRGRCNPGRGALPGRGGGFGYRGRGRGPCGGGMGWGRGGMERGMGRGMGWRGQGAFLNEEEGLQQRAQWLQDELALIENQLTAEPPPEVPAKASGESKKK